MRLVITSAIDSNCMRMCASILYRLWLILFIVSPSLMRRTIIIAPRVTQWNTKRNIMLMCSRAICTRSMIMAWHFSDSKLGSSTPDIARYVRLYIIMGSVTAGVGDTYRMRMCACWLRNMLWIMISCSLRITRSRIIIRPILPGIPNVRMCACTSCTGGMVVLRKFSDSSKLGSSAENVTS